eukprot:m.22331 g.22331  ORF g.22331 m.22331 type:complete len:218 (-) comp3993_c0_seq2:268-921(-)
MVRCRLCALAARMSRSEETLATAHAEPVVEEVPEDDLQEGPARYLAFAARITRALRPMVRYAAYTSDFGEAFRPVVSHGVVRGAYMVTYGYVVADVGYNTWRAYDAGYSPMGIFRTFAHSATFQGVASVALPAVAVHQTVHLASRVLKRFKTSHPRVYGYGPTAVGLALIPLLPTLIDHPVEKIIDRAFEMFWPAPSHERMPSEHATHGDTPKPKSE